MQNMDVLGTLEGFADFCSPLNPQVSPLNRFLTASAADGSQGSPIVKAGLLAWA
jgi:hypothetical protein